MRFRTWTHFTKIPQIILDMNYIINFKMNYILQILNLFLCYNIYEEILAGTYEWYSLYWETRSATDLKHNRFSLMIQDYESVCSTIFIEYMLPKCLLAYFKITLPLLNISFEIIAIHDSCIWDRSDDYHSSLTFGEGNGTPLQYSCLEKPMDGGAW